MFLGLRTKAKKGRSVKVDYVVYVQEIAPWPPSQFLKSLRSVVLQWEYGDNVSGLTPPVTPSIEDGKIEFNQAFKLHATLVKDGPLKSSDGGHYHKNLLELNLYEPRNKNVKGQHIGGAVVDLAEHGVIKKPISFAVPFSCKRIFKNSSQAVVYLKIQPFDKAGSSSSSLESLPKEMLSDKDGKESVSSILTEEQSEEVEIASFTDEEDGGSRQSSNDLEVSKRTGTNNKEDSFHSQSTSEVSDMMPSEKAPSKAVLITYESATEPSRVDLKFRSSETDVVSCSMSALSTTKTSEEPAVDSSVPSAVCQNSTDAIKPDTIIATNHDLAEVEEKLVECNISTGGDLHQPSEREEIQHDISRSKKTSLSESKIEDNVEEVQSHSTPYKSSSIIIPKEQDSDRFPDSGNSPSNDEYGENIPLHDGHNVQKIALGVRGSHSPASSRRAFGGRTGTLTNDGRKHLKSVSLHVPDVVDFKDVKEIDVLEDTHVANEFLFKKNSEKIKRSSLNKQSGLSNFKIKELEKRVEMLERELREIAAIEISLYSVIAEHGTSSHKVHASARRLSRLCTYASEKWSPSARAGATRSIVSGLILAARACGNDVPRLTFWLSNIIVLRAIVTPVIEGLTLATTGNPGGNAVSDPPNTPKRSLKWEQNGTDKSLSFSDESYDWQCPKVFLEALEKVEAWIFSRIVESIWWQILTPSMQSGSDFEANTKLLQKRSSFMSPKFNDRRTNYSIDHWKKAFKESYERLCPVRAEGHNCGCLPMLARLVMEQCIARLDVAMFNALLRDSDDEIPGNPISDPISDPKVLPIPLGKLSFSTGAQLKNAVGTWCRWLTDLFGIDDDLSENEEDRNDGRRDLTALKTFSLLNALSDLLMLPKDMLLDSSTRKKVCPVFNAYMMKQILGSFVPDEFSPVRIPDPVFDALDSEDPTEDEDAVTSFPFEAAPVRYHPPSMMSVMLLIGHAKNISLQRNSSSLLRKCHTSDDELDELNSPLTSIVMADKHVPSYMVQTEKSSMDITRYALLREVWRHED